MAIPSGQGSEAKPENDPMTRKNKFYKAILFDLDGTLLDSKKDIAQATNATLVHMGCAPITEETIYTYVGHGVRDLIRGALGQGSREREDAALAYFNVYYCAHCTEHSRLFKGGEAVLNAFQLRGVHMAILTNKPKGFTDQIVSALNLSKYVGFVVSAEGVYPNKPDKTGALAILEHFGVSPSDALMVGDSVVDLQTAENTGMDCALMLNGFSPREEILMLKARATHVCEELAELLVFTKGD